MLASDRLMEVLDIGYNFESFVDNFITATSLLLNKTNYSQYCNSLKVEMEYHKSVGLMFLHQT